MKRVIGLPGDRVQVRSGTVWVNGLGVAQTPLAVVTTGTTRWTAAGRARRVGMLPAENIVGRAEVVVTSWRQGAGLLKPWTWLNLQTDRFFQRVRQGPLSAVTR